MERKQHHKNKPSFEEIKFLIISEDSKSFPSYFKKVLHEFGFRPDTGNKRKILLRRTTTDPKRSISVEIERNITNCLNIVKHGKNQSENFNKIYCVFDYLKNGTDASYKNAMSTDIPKNIIRINSVPSYELWLLLHFTNSSRQFHGDHELIKLLKETIRSTTNNKNFNYSKSEMSDDLFELLKTRLESAVKNAKNLEKENKITGKESSSSTKIYQLIEDFKNIF